MKPTRLSEIRFETQECHSLCTSPQAVCDLGGTDAGIYAAAASRTEDVKYIIAVGASVADGTMFYYRDNLFRLYGLSDTLRDVAEKAHLAQWDLH